MQEFERDWNGGLIRKCAECEWFKSLEDSEGNTHYFCMDVNGGAFLEETGICGYCTVEENEEEKQWTD